jgi:hypothetical protein
MERAICSQSIRSRCMRSLSIRAKLTVWYLMVTSAALLLFGLLSFGALKFALLRVKKASVDRREQRLLRYLDQSKHQAAPLPLIEQLQNYALITHEGNLFQLRGPDGESIFPGRQTSAEWISSVPENCAQPVFRAAQFEGQPLIVRCHLVLRPSYTGKWFCFAISCHHRSSAGRSAHGDSRTQCHGVGDLRPEQQARKILTQTGASRRTDHRTPRLWSVEHRCRSGLEWRR